MDMDVRILKEMCCMNLSDHSKSIHARIKELQMSKLCEQSESDWLTSLFDNWQIAGRIKNLLKIGCLMILIIFLHLTHCAVFIVFFTMGPAKINKRCFCNPKTKRGI